MTAIGSKGKTNNPAVNVRFAAVSKQTTFGFNASLVRLLDLTSFKRVGLDYDAEANTLTFTPTNEEQHDGAGTYTLGHDGGAKSRAKLSARRAAHVRRSATEFAKPGTYLVRTLDAPRFAIVMDASRQLGEQSPAAATKVASPRRSQKEKKADKPKARRRT